MYRPNVGIMLKNPTGLVFAGKRVSEQFDYWQMPQGGIDDGETIEAAARRELYEETGIKSIRIVGTTPDWITYDFLRPAYDKDDPSQVVYGQKQKWVLMDFCGDESEIDLNHHIPEFCAHAWITAQEAITKVIPLKRKIYEHAFAYFSDNFSD